MLARVRGALIDVDVTVHSSVTVFAETLISVHQVDAHTGVLARVGVAFLQILDAIVAAPAAITFACILVAAAAARCAGATIEAWRRGAFVNVVGTIDSAIAGAAFASIRVDIVDTSS